MKELTDTITALPLEEKISLFNLLAEQIRNDRSRKVDTAKGVTDAACGILGLDRYHKEGRKRIFIICKVLIANALIRIGMTEAIIGDVLGMNRTTIYRYEYLLQSWFDCPDSYGEELSYWNQLLLITRI